MLKQRSLLKIVIENKMLLYILSKINKNIYYHVNTDKLFLLNIT